jgi:rubrerythrin
VDISRDHTRRVLGDIGRQHDEAMKQHEEALDRLVNERDLSFEEADQTFLGGLSRRRFLTIGGISVASAAIFAACGSTSKLQSTPSSTTLPPSSNSGSSGSSSSSSAMASSSDVTILRTASSLEYLAVATYNDAIKSGLVTNKTVAAVAVDFRNQHMQHAAAFDAATKQAGGTPFTKPNPAVYDAVVKPALAKLKNQTGVLELAYTLENAAAETYVNIIGKLSVPAYNSAAASVAGVESRHVTVLGTVLTSAGAMGYPTYVASGFYPVSGAVKAGTGVG